MSTKLLRYEEKGWKRGLRNLLQGEMSSWFGSSRWWKQLLLWMVLVNLMMVFIGIGAKANPDDGPDFLFLYGIFGGMFVAFGVMIRMQRTIVGEVREGTAGWILSKPVTRSAFVASRLLGNTIGILVTSTIIPAVLVYITAAVMTPLGWLPPLGFAAGVLIYCLHAFFWISLTVMMGTISLSSGVVIAVPIGLYFALWFLPSLLPGLMYIDPLILTFADPDVMKAVGHALMVGEPVATWFPVISTVLLSGVFVAVAIWRFGQQEF